MTKWISYLNIFDSPNIKQHSLRVHNIPQSWHRVLTMGDLRDLTMGVYQLKQALQYTREHIEPEYELVLVKDDPNLIR
jgi:hypothetical protein